MRQSREVVGDKGRVSAPTLRSQHGRSWLFSVRWMHASSTITLSLAEQIAATIGDRIITDVYKPGTRVIEQDVADEFQVSRGPVRDAFHMLEREGLATLHRNRGLTVTQLGAEEVRNLFEIRGALFAVVAQHLATRSPPHFIQQFDQLIDELETFLDDEDGDRYAETVFRLSLASAREAQNPRLAEMIASLSLQTLRYSKLGLRSRERRRESIALWRATRDAIRAGDVPLATKLAVERIQRSRDEALQAIEAATPPMRDCGT
jgi:DNA-binding GntR family transcriptional regulator